MTVILGAQWLPAIPLIKVLAFYGCVASLGTNTGVVFMACGRPHLMTLMAGVHVAVLVPALVFATRAAGTQGAAIAVLATMVALTPLNFCILGRELRLGAVALVGTFWRPVCAATLMYALVGAVLRYPFAAGLEGSIAGLAAGLATGVLSYAAALALLWRLAGLPAGAEATILARVRAFLGRRQ